MEQKLKQIELNIVGGNESEVSQSELAETSKEFIDKAVETDDWRYLNTAMKINDMLREKKALPNEIEQAEQEALNILKEEVLK